MLRAVSFRKLLLVATAMVSLLLVAGFLAPFHPAFDSLSHFRVHLAALLAVMSVALLAGRHRGVGLLSMLLCIGAFATVADLSGSVNVHASLPAREPGTALYRLLQLNLRYDNSQPGKVLSLIGRIQPDVVTLQEVSFMWDSKLALLAASYPYGVRCRDRVFGVAILSRRPVLERAGCLDEGALASATVDFGDRHVEVATLHLDWPWPFGQAEQVDALEPALGRLSETTLLAGDLNATPWSATARRIAEAGGVSRFGPAGPTWSYRRLPDFLRFAGLPIDHVFARGEVIVHDVRSLEPVGSDHLPVLVEFSLAAPTLHGETAMARLAGAAAIAGRLRRLRHATVSDL